MKMKKIVQLICIFLMISGCSSRQETKKTSEEELYFLFATPLAEHEVWLQAKVGFEDGCKKKQIHCDWIGPTAIDTMSMNEVIETGILQNANAIITQGVVSEELVSKAKASGIPIFLVDSDMPQSERFAYLGKNFEEQARLLLEDIETKMGKDEFLKIGIQVAEQDFSIASDQIKQIENIFKEHPSGFEITSITESKSDAVRAKKEWMGALSSNEINVSINFAGESAISCSEVAIELGKRKSMLIYGVDDMPTTIDLIANEAIDGSIVTSFYNYGYESVMWLFDYIRSGTSLNEEVNSVKLVLVNKENVTTYKEELK